MSHGQHEHRDPIGRSIKYHPADRGKRQSGFPGGTGTFIAWLEVVGGVAMILGIFTRVFGVVFGIEMFVAIIVTGGIGTGYKPHELEIVLTLLSFGLALSGSGKYSLWKMECDDCGGMLCDRDTTCPVKK